MNEHDTIENIIGSLNQYALGDIKHNEKKTIAAFILAVCFIDCIAGYIYNSDDYGNRWIRFVNEYLYPGEGKRLYGGLRSSLIHNYSLSGLEGITSDELPEGYNDKIITYQKFIKDTEIAFNNFSEKIRTDGSKERENALAWEKKYPILKLAVHNF